jgi:hypothetical protein
MPNQLSVVLPVPYLSQLDNENSPYGTCNLTSVSMILLSFGIVGNGEGQLEDQLFRKCEQLGLDRHEPRTLAALIREYGFIDDFRPDARWDDAKEWLRQGNPLIVHGYFTKSGHIIVIKGFNEHGFIVNDPYGEWYAEGYDTSVSGEGLTYSYGMMERLCGVDGDLWLHFCSK